jgi:nitrite reductase/ring-hydroxylating ferredoxin subunit
MAEPVTVAVADLAPLGTRGFEVTLPGGRQEAGLLVRGADGVCRAYANRCPHVPRYSLDFGDADVVDRRDGLIVCANHGARFTVETGLCTSGPCRGRELFAWPCEERAGVAHIDAGPLPEGWPHGAMGPGGARSVGGL